MTSGICLKTSQGLRGQNVPAGGRDNQKSEESACYFIEIQKLSQVFALGEKNQIPGERETDFSLLLFCAGFLHHGSGLSIQECALISLKSLSLYEKLQSELLIVFSSKKCLYFILFQRTG